MQRNKIKSFLNSMDEGEKQIIYNIIAVGFAKDQFTVWEIPERSDNKNFLLFLSTLAFKSPLFIILIELQPITLQSRGEWGVHLTGASVGVPLQSTLLQDAQPQSQN